MFVTHSPMRLPMEALGREFLKVGEDGLSFISGIHICSSYNMKDLDKESEGDVVYIMSILILPRKQVRCACFLRCCCWGGNTTGNDIIDIR